MMKIRHLSIWYIFTEELPQTIYAKVSTPPPPSFCNAQQNMFFCMGLPLAGFRHQVPGIEAARQSPIQHRPTLPSCGQVYRGGCGCWRGGACQLSHGGETTSCSYNYVIVIRILVIRR